MLTMPYGEIEVKSLGHGEELTSEPCYKRLKSTEEAYVFSHRGGADFRRVREKTGNDWAPVTILDFKGSSHPREDKRQTTDLSKPLHDVMPQNRPDTVGCIESHALKGAGLPLAPTDDGVHSTSKAFIGPVYKPREDDGVYSTSKAFIGPVYKPPEDDGVYSTSKAFIGPVYKPPEKKKCNERRNQADTINGINGKGGREEKHKYNSPKSEIDSELSQFYKEIEELENEKGDWEDSCQGPEPPPEQLPPRYQDHHRDPFRSNEEKGPLSNSPPSQCGYQQDLGNKPGEYPCDGQVVPPFCDISCTSFRPEWQSVPSFIVPRGPLPPLPSFNCHFDTQRFNAPPNPPSGIFHVPDDPQPGSGCYVNSCPDNWACPTSGQNDEYTFCPENSSSVHRPRNDYSVHDGLVSNGFCETGGEWWRDPPMDQWDRTDMFMNQRFQEEKLHKLQKLLILLRGLPGSGKTTLSRILLGQSRDGIVFSTDDYFRYQDGYRYNVNQLGDAHDWNQNRAKQAMAQGRSPVIIDNTNTQAWEMKPYVEMAIGKGYRVEFHEPETWWKFDPEELEKRNKHGVSRKKIAQMLERYEYQVSISVVMNSVEPSHKGTQGTQRPPPPPGRQRERDLKETGHGLRKLKQKRNRKRNKTQTNYSEIVGKNACDVLSYLTPGAQEPSQSEEEDLEETKREPRCTLTGGLGNKRRGFVDGSKEESQKNMYLEERFPNVTSVVELYNTPKNYPPKEGDNLLLSLSSIPSGSSVACQAVTQNLSSVTRGDCSGVKVEKQTENTHAVPLDVQDGFAEGLYSLMPKREAGEKSLLCHQRGSKTSRQVLIEEQGVNTPQTNEWAFFSTDLSDEELQLASAGQPYFGSWPEGPHTFICEQRPKKGRWRRQACPDGRGHLVKLISTCEGVPRPGNSPELLIEKKLLIEDENLSSSAETTDSFIETSIFRNYLPELGSPRKALVSTKNKTRRQMRTFSLAPNFGLQGQANNVKEMGKGVLLVENHGLKLVWGAEKDRISEINDGKEKKENRMTSNPHPLCFSLDIIKDLSLFLGGRFYPRCLPFNRLGRSVWFYHSPVSSLMLQYTSSFWKLSLTSRTPFLTSGSQTMVDHKQDDLRLVSPEILCHQPDTLYSFKLPSDHHFLSKRVGDKLEKEEEARPFQSSQTEENQDFTRTTCTPPGLPLSQEFAFQLVRLFGSPGVPMDSLLPEDYVVPLDWKTLKMIYSQWKTSVEKRQKKIA
ncbi:NEDD4-binding protein 2-like 2 isoform X2 [Loxodonta africana]|uniref:NEDD4-binding protein 2-like 2 isoform X2 n=1 Tax=Loxodonta africana TaxID=9785 RepID=UPI0030CD57E0